MTIGFIDHVLREIDAGNDGVGMLFADPLSGKSVAAANVQYSLGFKGANGSQDMFDFQIAIMLIRIGGQIGTLMQRRLLIPELSNCDWLLR